MNKYLGILCHWILFIFWLGCISIWAQLIDINIFKTLKQMLQTFIFKFHNISLSQEISTRYFNVKYMHVSYQKGLEVFQTQNSMRVNQEHISRCGLNLLNIHSCSRICMLLQNLHVVQKKCSASAIAGHEHNRMCGLWGHYWDMHMPTSEKHWPLK